MDYKSFLSIARGEKTFQKIDVEGGQTDGHLSLTATCDCVKSIPSNSSVRKELGRAYARKYQEEDEMEDILLKRFEEVNPFNSITGAEDLTSRGTMPNIGEIFADNLSQVYDNYSFDHKISLQLLINGYKDQILEEIEQNAVVIIKGQTGCGKSTQVPQFILDSCRESNIHCNIVITQPRRIAAISIAKRVAYERNWELGSLVGYQVALEKQVSEDTRLLFCTSGVLLQMIISKQSISNFTHVIIDEIHERDSETDFLLIVIKKLLRTPGNRTKVILMSATINTDKFAHYFSKRVKGIKLEPPIIELETRTRFPVQYFYLESLVDRIPITMPLLRLSEPKIDKNAYDLAALLVEVFHTIDAREHSSQPFVGSVLIFLPGLHEIEIMFEALERRKAKSKITEKWMLCPLHSTVTNDEQLKVFKYAPAGHRKIIIATNIAESSITVPDVKYVIDFCLMKIQVQERATSYNSLQLCWASKSQAVQRAGRVGRVMPGRVYRLVSESLFKKFNDECMPEILRCSLDTLVLRAKELDIGPPSALLGRAMDPPDLSNIQTNILNLKEMGGLLMTTNGEYDEFDGDLTFLGKVMASLPIDPCLSKLIIVGHMFSCLEECVIMASAMAVKSIFSTPFKKQLDAYNSKLSWANYSASDPIAFLNAYKLWRYKVTTGLFKRSGGVSEEAWADKYFIQLKSLREVARLEGEIISRLKRLGITSISGTNRVFWSDQEKPLILKIIIAGAFYPNYFLRNQTDERGAVKVLGGRDPFTTVYLSNMPTNQPGPLYIEAIKQYFHHCGASVNVSFDGSSKVYLTFGSSCKTEDRKSIVRAPGSISLAVYRAIKLRHLQIPITISVLQPSEALKRAEEIFGDCLSLNIKCWNKKKKKTENVSSLLPGINTTVLPIVITHVNSPGHFYCHINDEVTSQKHVWLYNELNKPGNLIPLAENRQKVDSKVVASYIEDKKVSFYRAVILGVDREHGDAHILFIDYGNEADVRLDELMDYTEKLIEIGVRDEPSLAIECTLAEIQPSTRTNSRGQWSKSSYEEFKNYFKNRQCVALIYSVVHNVMAVTLFHPNKAGNLSHERSFNHEFIKSGYAELAEEPYLSRENHVMRTMAEKCPNTLKTYSPLYLEDDTYAQFQFEPPNEKECLSKILLKGPKSPLEMSLHSLTKKSQDKDVLVEWNSVNSVLLDTVPMDSHDRLMIASNVTQSPNTERLTLRNTTLLPNMHGLPSLIMLIFSPYVELRTDPERETITGALCGLGFKRETGESYHPENDIEFMFDTKFTLQDIEYVNKLRFWMNFIIEGNESYDIDLTNTRMIKGQSKIKEYILELIGKTRPSVAPLLYDDSFSWNQLPQDVLLDPRGPNASTTTSVYSLIWGVDLNSNERSSKIDSLKAHLDLLQQYNDDSVGMRNSTKCELCQVYLDDIQSLRLHLETTLHKTNYIEFCKSS